MMNARLSTWKGSAAGNFAFLFLALWMSAVGHCAYIVVPNDLIVADGNGADQYPFGIRFTNSSMRYQQVYHAAQFTQTPTNAALITEINFRIDSLDGYPFGGTLPNI